MKNKSKFKLPNFECPNCKNIIPWERPYKLYCSDICREEAKYVRYHRRIIDEGREKDFDIKLALEIKKVSAASGGYSAKLRRLPNSVREKVLSMANRRCTICKKHANEIDHIKGSSNDLCNLQVLCKKCHSKKTLNNHKPLKLDNINSINIAMKYVELEKRVSRKNPIKECDNHKIWKKLEKEIQQKFKNIFYTSVYNFTVKNLFNSEKHDVIAIKLNQYKIPTYSGSGIWDRKLVREKLKR